MCRAIGPMKVNTATHIKSIGLMHEQPVHRISALWGVKEWWVAMTTWAQHLWWPWSGRRVPTQD